MMNDAPLQKLIGLHFPNWLDDMQRQVESAAEKWPTSHVFAFLDCAFSERCYATIRKYRLPSRSLYDLSRQPSDKLQSVSPTLIPLTRDTAHAWRDVLAHTDGWPMLSIIVTPESLDDLALRLSPWCIVSADGQAFVFRFPDTRRLPAIVDTLTPDQHGALFGPAHAWRYRTRAARWAELPLPATACPPAEQVNLRADQYVRLITDSEADQVIEDLNRNDPVLMKRYHPADAHELITFGLKRADYYGISTADRTQWCSLILQQPKLDQLPASMPLLSALVSRERGFSDIESELSALLHS